MQAQVWEKMYKYKLQLNHLLSWQGCLEKFMWHGSFKFLSTYSKIGRSLSLRGNLDPVWILSGPRLPGHPGWVSVRIALRRWTRTCHSASSLEWPADTSGKPLSGNKNIREIRWCNRSMSAITEVCNAWFCVGCN